MLEKQKSKKKKYFIFLISGSRETAFISAISAAGVVVAVGKACKRDDVTMCGCGDDIRPNNLNSRWVRYFIKKY